MAERETVRIRLVPMNDEDEQPLRSAVALLRSLGHLLQNDDWEGFETMKGLVRIIERVETYSASYEIPIPMSPRGSGPLFTYKEKE